MYVCIGGWGVSPTGKSYSFRSCVRACEAVCARETMFLPMARIFLEKGPPVCVCVCVWRGPPLPP